MNIAFDATAMLGPLGRGRGIGNYVLSQFQTMLAADKSNRYFCINIYGESVFGHGSQTTLQENPQANPKAFDNFTECMFWCGKDAFLFAKDKYSDIYGALVSSFIRKYNIDVFYITSPFERLAVQYKPEWFGSSKVNVIAAVYDIIPYVMKQLYLTDAVTAQWYMQCVETLRFADKLLAISHSTKDDLINHLGFDGTKIDVIGGAASRNFCKITVPDDEKQYLFDKFGITGPFIMCPAGDDIRKNIDSMISAYARLPKSLIDSYQLVIVCKLSPQSLERYENLAKISIAADAGIPQRVVFTGYVTDDELSALYNAASLVAFPSLYEGFGLPIVEAFACGTPVLTSNTSAMKEIAEDAAVLVSPDDVSDITRGVEYALTKADTAGLVKAGYKKLKVYNWDNVAGKTLDVINSFKPAAPESATAAAAPVPSPRPKIAFFTPLPPLESGIADYSVDILNALSAYLDIDVYIDDGYEPRCTLSDNVSICNHKDFPAAYDTDNCTNINIYNHKFFAAADTGVYKDIIYQVGNSEYHLYMLDYLRRYKGIVVLHEYNLHSQFYHATVLKNTLGNITKYKEILLEDYPQATVNRYLHDLSGSKCTNKINEMEVNGYVTNYAGKIIVHSEDAKAKLLHKNIAIPVRTIRHYAVIEPLVNNCELKEKHGFASNDIIMAAFGHILETKRALQIVKAFGRLCKNYDNDNVRLIFAGKLSDEIATDFNDCLKTCADTDVIREKITVTGYISIDEFKEYIDLSDICLNLRYPYNGETSGSLMRCLAKGKCIIVSDIGSFGEIPGDCCIKLPSAERLTEEQEIGYIYKAMESLTSDESKCRELSKQAREYAQENLDIKIIARQYFDFITADCRHALTEDLLDSIICDGLTADYTRENLRELSKTLAFSIT